MLHWDVLASRMNIASAERPSRRKSSLVTLA